MAPAPAAVRRRAGRRFIARGVEASGGGGGPAWRVLLAEALVPAPAPAADAPAVAGRDPAPSGTGAAVAARVTPAVLFVTVVLAVVLLVSGLLHVLRRLFLKSHHANAGAAERQLQHLFFPPHEDGAGAGLDRAAIDALPEFAYCELSAAVAARAGKGKAKADRPFDCAVCLSEFVDDDRLRLLPLCGHAFHAKCIDVWLRTSATCPLCRAKLTARLLAAAETPVEPDVEAQKQEQAPDEATTSVVLPVRLGRFRNAAPGAADDTEASTSSRLDARRCYSMGSYQYVLADDHILVSVRVRNGNASSMVAAAASSDGQQGKKVYARGDSFSVSKIWQWRGSGRRLPADLCTGASSPGDDGLPWAPAARQGRDT